MEEEKKKKKAYCKPELHVEEFTPNEYIGSCWQVACTQGLTGDYVGKDKGDKGTKGQAYMDHTGSCSEAKNNIITNTGMHENSSDQGEMEIDLLVPYHDYSAIKTGMEITWTTKNEDGRVWTHKGVTSELVPGHPLMS